MAVGGVGAGPPGADRILPREPDAARPLRPFELGTGEAGAEERGRPPRTPAAGGSPDDGTAGPRDREAGEAVEASGSTGTASAGGPRTAVPDPTGRGRLVDIRV